MTSNHQPADMGMIAALKVGYRVIMLIKLLKIFDQEGEWEAAELSREKMMKGLKGIEYGRATTVLDAMLIVHDIWKVDGRYASEDGIRRCWRKAGISPIAMETAINADLGSNSTPATEKKLSKEDCDELCSLLETLHVKGNQVREEVKKTPLCLLKVTLKGVNGRRWPMSGMNLRTMWIFLWLWRKRNIKQRRQEK